MERGAWHFKKVEKDKQTFLYFFFLNRVKKKKAEKSASVFVWKRKKEKEVERGTARVLCSAWLTWKPRIIYNSYKKNN